MEGQPGKILNVALDNLINFSEVYTTLFRNTTDGRYYARLPDGSVQTFAVPLNNILGETTNATPTELFVNGINGFRFFIPLNNAVFIQVFIVASRVDGASAGASGVVQMGALIKNVGGVVSFVVPSGGPQVFVGDAEAGAWTADLSIVANEVVFTVTGEVGKTIRFSGQSVVLAQTDFNP